MRRKMSIFKISYVCSQIKFYGCIRPFRRDPETNKVPMLEEYRAIPKPLKKKIGLPLDEMAQILFNNYVIPDPSVNCLLMTIESEIVNYEKHCYNWDEVSYCQL